MELFHTELDFLEVCIYNDKNLIPVLFNTGTSLKVTLLFVKMFLCKQKQVKKYSLHRVFTIIIIKQECGHGL